MTAHFHVDTGLLEPRIVDITLTNLDAATCDGSPVTVLLRGNAAGDPSAAASDLLATLDSTTSPCTTQPLNTPKVVTAGTIELASCPTVSVHDVTLMVVRIGDGEVALPADQGGGPGCVQSGDTCVLGEKVTRRLSLPAQHPSSLAFTGAWIARWSAMGLALLVCGLFVTLARKPQTSLSTEFSTTLTKH